MNKIKQFRYVRTRQWRQAIACCAVILSLSVPCGKAGAAEWKFDQNVDPALTVPYGPDLAFPEGFKATVRFSCDFDLQQSKQRFMNVICLGQNYHDGFSLMVRDDGQFRFFIKDIEPGVYIYHDMVKPNQEYLVEIYFTRENVRLFMNGKEDGSFSYAGTANFLKNKNPFRIGTTGSAYRFKGSIPFVKIEPLSAVEVPPGGPHPIGYQPPKVQNRAELFWIRPICVETNRYIGWPTVTCLQNGDLMAVFSGDRDAHVCPWGKVKMVRSSDGGESWSQPVTLANGPIDDRDAGIVQMPDGDIIVTWFTSLAYRLQYSPTAKLPSSDRCYWWRRHDEKISDEVRKEALGHFRVISSDNGKTWSKPERMNGGITPHGPSLLRDGSLLMLSGFHHGGNVLGIRAERSTDKGLTWQCLCKEIPPADGEGKYLRAFHEPNALELADGTILAMIRYEGGDNYLRDSISRDGGKTWTKMRKTPMLGFPAHMIQLPDGKVVCVYSRRYPKNGGCGEYACISDDGGKSWDIENEICLASWHYLDLGYPSTARLPDGTLLTIFYQQEKPFDLPCLMATKWRVTR
jgi:hypothetical protein